MTKLCVQKLISAYIIRFYSFCIIYIGFYDIHRMVEETSAPNKPKVSHVDRILSPMIICIHDRRWPLLVNADQMQTTMNTMISLISYKYYRDLYCTNVQYMVLKLITLLYVLCFNLVSYITQVKAARPKPVVLWTSGDVQKWLRRHCSDLYEQHREKFAQVA